MCVWVTTPVLSGKGLCNPEFSREVSKPLGPLALTLLIIPTHVITFNNSIQHVGVVSECLGASLFDTLD